MEQTRENVILDIMNRFQVTRKTAMKALDVRLSLTLPSKEDGLKHGAVTCSDIHYFTGLSFEVIPKVKMVTFDLG